MKLFSASLLIVIVSTFVAMLFVSMAHATTPTYPPFYTAVGIFQYQAGTNPIKPVGFNVGNFTTLGLCNSAISDFNNLLISGSNTPNGSQNTKSVLDGLCFAVLPPQISGWKVLGLAQVQQSNQIPTPINFEVGSFQDEATCKKALTKLKGLVLSHTPANNQEVTYSFTGGCYKLID